MDNLDLLRQSKPMFGMLRNNSGEVDGGEGSGEGDGGGDGGGDGAGAGSSGAGDSGEGAGTGWKSNLGSDIANSPLVQKFDDTQDGLNKAFMSHANLEQMLGHDKVPIPKGPDDTEGWNRFSKAMGIPDKAEGYGLPDAELPEGMQGLTFDKNQFAEITHGLKLTPSQAQGLWKAYTTQSAEKYGQAIESQKSNIANTINQLKSEWGDAYETNIELAQTVINKFAADQEANDYLTATLIQDPIGTKFLAKLGNQFAENKIVDFQIKRFSLAPEEMQEEIDKSVSDLQGPYMNSSGKFTDREHQAAMDRVNFLRASINKARKGQA